MDVTTLPANLQALYQIIANPITFGILVSMILAQVPFMNDDKVANWKKMLTVLGSCLLWAIGVTALSPDGIVLTKDGIYGIVLLAFSVAFSSQIWHTVVSPFIAQIIEILFGVAANLKARAARLALNG